jgi:ATP-binding cassette subfamily B protein
VLDGVTFDVLPGRTTAVIGSTGSGKTTVVNLATRLADVSAGAVLLDGVDLRATSDADLRRRVGLVPQRPYLFAGTVATNLRFGRPDATDEELWTALRAAQAADFVEAMTGGLDAPISQGGTNVSGGQRQRLSIARLLVQAPAVHVFDDAFSALDTATDARLRSALARTLPDAAILVVAQRVSTIVDADEIVVLEAGKVVGRGRHDELLGTCPTYLEIVSSQLEVTA